VGYLERGNFEPADKPGEGLITESLSIPVLNAGPKSALKGWTREEEMKMGAAD